MANAPNSAPLTGEAETPNPAVERLVDVAADKLQSVVGQTSDFASRIVEQGQDVSAHVQEVAGNLKGAVGKSIKDQPVATLAMVAALGFVLGAIWKA